jgi:hypothetical protein
LGDIIAACAVLKTLHEATGQRIQLVLGPKTNPSVRCIGPRLPIGPERFNFIAPLLRRQPYIEAVFYDSDPPFRDLQSEGFLVPFLDFSTFRQMAFPPGTTLIAMHAAHVGVGADAVSLSPWIEAEPIATETPYSVFIRSPRYRSGGMDWQRYIDAARCGVFIGHDGEWSDFAATFRLHDGIRRVVVSDALHAARIIAGAATVCCNQTFGFWVSAALGKRTHVEAATFEDNCNLGLGNITMHYAGT